MEFIEALMMVIGVDLNVDDRRPTVLIRLARGLQRAAQLLAAFDASCPASSRFGDLYKVKRRREFGGDDAIGESLALRPLWPAERPIVENNPRNRCSFLDG